MFFAWLAYYMNGWWATTATTSIFIAAAITDWLDGYIARKVCGHFKWHLFQKVVQCYCMLWWNIFFSKYWYTSEASGNSIWGIFGSSGWQGIPIALCSMFCFFSASWYEMVPNSIIGLLLTVLKYSFEFLCWFNIAYGSCHTSIVVY